MPDKPPRATRRPRPLTATEVTAAIQYCLRKGNVIPTKHFRERGFRRNYTIQDAINVLKFGEVSSHAPQWNERAKGWSYRVHGPDLEGDVLTVVVGIGRTRDTVWLVTPF